MAAVTLTLTELLAQHPNFIESACVMLCREEPLEPIRVLPTGPWSAVKLWTEWQPNAGKFMLFGAGLHDQTATFVLGRVNGQKDRRPWFFTRELHEFLDGRGWRQIDGYWGPPAKACTACPSLLACTLSGRTST